MNDLAPVRIRPALSGELQSAARMLGLRFNPPVVLIAGLPQKRQIIGAAAVWPPAGAVLHRGLRFSLFVAPAYRRRKIGSGLMQSLIEKAVSVKAAGLFSAAHLTAGPESEFLESFGFEAVRRKLFFTCPMSAVREHISPIVRKAKQSGLLKDAEVKALENSDPEKVSELYTSCLGAFLVPEEELFSAGPRSFHPLSPVLHLNETVIGAILGRYSDGVATADAYIVHPEFRKTSAGPTTAASCGRDGASPGYRYL